MHTRSRTLETPDGPMRLYEAMPDRPRGALVVVMEAFGLNDHIEDVTRRAAAEGWHAVSPDLLHRAGLPPAPYDDLSKLGDLFAPVSADTVTTDLDATFADLESLGFAPGNTGITGFCWGGWVSFFAAARRPLGAAVTWYGGGIAESGRLPFPALIDEIPTMETPWLGLFGELDQHIPPAHLDAIEAAFAEAALPIAHDLVRYADADHGFHCDDRPMYHAEAAADGWARAMDWFTTHLVD